jgi:predicted nucleic acid-binding protein
MDLVLLDTDTLSEVLKQRNPTVAMHAAAYLAVHSQFAFSAFTRFETLRGYKASKATRQLPRFATFCAQSLVLPVTDAIFDRAADLWVAARQGGYPCGDADLVIAATAIEHGRRLVTGNASHFAWIAGLPVDDWRQP